MTVNNGLLDELDLVCDLPGEANLNLADPMLVQYYKDYQNRYIYITKDIDESLFNEMKLILTWNKEDDVKGIPIEKRVPITVFVHSYGGDLYSAMGFLSVMKLSKCTIRTVNLSCAMSCGALIFINGHKGHRYALKNSTALLHSGSAAQGGSYDSVVQQTQQYKNLISRVNENILENTKISKATLTKKMKTDWYLDDNMQLEYSLCDYVVDDISQIIS